MRIATSEQHTADWFTARCGKVGASTVWKVMDFLKTGSAKDWTVYDFIAKGKESSARANYKAEIIAEILSGLPTEHYVSPAMDHGSEYEKIARVEYELATGNDVSQTGFVLHPSMDRFGASPDGLVGSDGSIEIKCPNTSTFIKWRFAGVVPEEHRDQMQAVMLCCERKWCDFVAFDPRLPERYRLWVVRLERDEQRIAQIEAGVLKFWEEVIADIKALDESCPEIDRPVRAENGAPIQATGDEFSFLDQTELMP
jgi:predicted phage-related endonuclease